MPRITFTPNLQRHVVCPTEVAPGRTVREVLENAFRGHPQARSYVFDEQGAIRKHMVVFVDGRQVQDRRTLSDPVPDDGEVYVSQALSGG